MLKLSVSAVLVFLLLTTTQLFAQKTAETDSTYLALQKIKVDSIRIKKTNEYAYSLIIAKKPLGSDMANLAIKNAQQFNSPHLLGITYLTVGYAYIFSGEYTKAYPLYMQALAVYQKTNEPKNLLRAYQDLTWIQIQLKAYDNAEQLIQTAIQIAKKENLIPEQAVGYNFLGILNDSQNRYDRAIESYKLALSLNEKKGIESNQISTLMNLGVSQRRAKKFKDALASFEKSKILVDKGNIAYYKQSVYQNLAELTFEMKDYEKAEKYILLALTHSKGNNELVLKRGLFTNLSTLYKNKGDYQKALAYTDSVSKIDQDLYEKEKVAEILNLQAKYDTKLKDEKIVNQNVLNLQQQQQLLLNRNLLQLTLEQKQNSELLFTKRQAELENQKKLQAATMQKDRLQAKIAKQASEQQIFAQKKEIETKNRFQLFFGVLALMAIVIAVIIFYNQRKTRKLNELITLQKKDLEQVNAVKDRIFSIIGHDLRAPVNTLISFNHLLEDHELSSDKIKAYAEKISKTLNHTSVLMENLLNWSRSQLQGYQPYMKLNSLKDIADGVVNALTIQALKKNIKIINDIDADAKVFSDVDMTELIMRNLVANAIKFTAVNGVINLSALQQNNITTFKVTDSGIGMPTELLTQLNGAVNTYHQTSRPGTNKETGTGLGLMLCKTFANLMGGGLKVSSENGKGTVVEVSFKRAA
ncbi:MAG: tetratricopeptide repeat protein [Pedobacter sp.]|nr:MAG: tetratricopeptide repeat protein [Pedobacter sp.]